MADRNYAETYRRSMTEPEAFWAEQAASLRWTKPWDRVLADNGEVPPKQMHRWFEGGELNTGATAPARWIDEGRGEHAALSQDSHATNRSAGRPGGNECGSRWSTRGGPQHTQKKKDK